MAMFACDHCNRIDDTREAGIGDIVPGKPLPRPLFCTVCQGRQWHRAFEYVEFDPKKDIVINRPSEIGFG